MTYAAPINKLSDGDPIELLQTIQACHGRFIGKFVGVSDVEQISGQGIEYQYTETFGSGMTHHVEEVHMGILPIEKPTLDKFSSKFKLDLFCFEKE